MTEVMPVGDSLTQGAVSTDGSGYRGPLYDLIVAGGKTVDFVGGQGGGAFAQPQHEGHGGWTTVMMAAQIYGWLSTYPTSVVLLCAGTNDLLNDATMRGGPAAELLGHLIDVIHAHTPSIEVLVSPIGPLLFSQGHRARAAQFNAAAQVVAGGRPNTTWVPMQWQNADISGDGIHPTDTGYARWAAAWHQSLRPLLA